MMFNWRTRCCTLMIIRMSALQFFGLVGSDSLAFANAIFRVDCSYSGHTVRVACHHSEDEFELAFVRDFVILAISDNNLRVYMICIYIWTVLSINGESLSRLKLSDITYWWWERKWYPCSDPFDARTAQLPILSIYCYIPCLHAMPLVWSRHTLDYLIINDWNQSTSVWLQHKANSS